MSNDNEEQETNEEKMEENEEKMEVDEDLSDSDSSDGEDEILEKRAKELETQISTNPYAYDTYIELVGIYKKLLNLTEMRNAYERFSKQFPLTGKLWLDWIKDEISIANTDNEKSYVINLFDRAVEDYLSVDLWLEYTMFSTRFETEFVRKVFEKAVNAAGLHFMNGSLIWDAYREYEMALLSQISDTETDDWKQQVLKVNDVYKRQLSVPLMEMERTNIEWRVWVEKLPKNDFIDKEPVNWVYKNATKYLRDFMEFEEKIEETNDQFKKLEVYLDYIDDNRKPEYIRCLYERAIAEFSLNGELWLEYCMYYFDLKDYETALKTCERALRNCYNSVDLWVLNIRILEIAGKNHDEVTRCLEKVMSYHLDGHLYLQVWLAYMDHFRRITNPEKPEEVEKIRDAFERGNKYLLDNFGFETDADCSFLRFWAKIEASFLKDITAARRIWNDFGILKLLGSTANSWLELLNLEQQYGDDKHIRKTYQRALSSTQDWPQSIAQSWIIYERQFGTIESIISTTESCQRFIKKWNKKHPVQYEESTSTVKNESSQKKQKSPNKRSFSENEYNKYNQKEMIKNDRKRKQDQRNSLEKEEKVVKFSNGSSEKQSTETTDNTEQSNQKEFKKIEFDSEKQKRSVFISNLDYSITEDQLKEFFNSPEELRLVKDRKGISRGYAYCVFSSIEEAQKTLKRDRELLHGRPVFISKCNADKGKREHNFQFATNRENNKLFIKNLPLTMTQEEIESLFKPYGEILEVRQVLFKNGRFKGLAYVEFKDDNDASKAVIGTDNTDIKGHIISVAISDPPKRKINTNLIPAPVEFSRHSKSRIQIPLVPRIVQTQAQVPKAPSSSSMTNEDFRKMLQKK